MGHWTRQPRACWPRDAEELQQYAYGWIPANCVPSVHMCDTDFCAHKVLRMAHWSWQPQFCDLLDFEATRLSQALAGKKTLFLGDSLMVEQFVSLRELLGALIVDKTNLWQFTTRHGALFDLHQAYFLVGDESNHSLPLNEPLEVDVRQGPWLDLAAQADIIVINTGHHWHARDPQFRLYSEMVSGVLRAVSAVFQGEHLIFRTSSWGHTKCHLEFEPNRNMADSQDDPYQWSKPIQNEFLWQDLASKHLSNHERFSVINASLTMQRADGHPGFKFYNDGHVLRDCLHNCLPGVADYWNWLLYNTLL